MTPRGRIYGLEADRVDPVLLAIATRVASVAPHAAAVAALPVLTTSLTGAAPFVELEPRLRAAFERVCGALGISRDDFPSASSSRLEDQVNVFFWYALRWTFGSDIADVEEAVELAEEILAMGSSPERARDELFAMIDACV